MLITKIYIHKYTDEYKEENHISKKLLADINIVIDCNIMINGIKLMYGLKGPYLIFPNDDKGRNIAYPIKEETRVFILNEILNKYEKEN